MGLNIRAQGKIFPHERSQWGITKAPSLKRSKSFNTQGNLLPKK